MNPATVKMVGIAFDNIEIAIALNKIFSDQENKNKQLDKISKALKNIEKILTMQLHQPLKSGITILYDAEAEYKIDNKKGELLANKALDLLNKAEGQLADLEQNIIASAGKAVAYKILNYKGAYNRTAEEVNKKFKELKEKREHENREIELYDPDSGDDSDNTFKILRIVSPNDWSNF